MFEIQTLAISQALGGTIHLYVPLVCITDYHMYHLQLIT